jgi:lipopolysaccharide/colanic/teichoic acid biosynthesis glycosyltransferase
MDKPQGLSFQTKTFTRTMTHTLPTLSLRKTKEVIFLNATCYSSTFAASSIQYKVQKLSGHDAYKQVLYLQCVSNLEEAPYAVIADYKLLAANNFAFVRILRANLFTQYIPLIAISDASDNIDSEILKKGIDDCYAQHADFHDICTRIEFLHKCKTALVELNENPTEEHNRFDLPVYKRYADIVIAGTCIVLVSPLLLLTALAIRLESKGNVIYRSKRSGRGYKVFDFFKFRSMHEDADTQLEDIQHLNQYSEENPTFIKVKNDPRMTKVGRFIRKTSIDELPQLFNVLRGDMSIVGNRPLPLYEAENLTSEDMAYRFMAPAGITGLWQVMRRGEGEMLGEERIQLDVEYAKEHSFWNDVKIVLKTPFALIQKENV